VELDEVKVVRLPDGKDPDEVLRDEPDRWREEVRTARPIVDYLIDTYATQHDLRSAGGKARFVDALIATIRAVPNPVMRDAYLQRVRQVSGVEERVLLEVLHRRDRGQPDRVADSSRITADAVTSSPDALPIGEILRAITPVEQELLRLLLLVPEEQLAVVDELGPDLLPSTVARELYRAIVLQRAPNDAGVHPPFDRDGLLAGLDDETRALALALYAKPLPDWRPTPPERIRIAVTNFVLDLEADRIEAQTTFNTAELAEAERSGDTAAIDRLLREVRLAEERRRSLDRRREQSRLLARPLVGRPS
jgi:DNA primase